jgi:tetratricopeptide (TPR) repeat protein
MRRLIRQSSNFIATLRRDPRSLDLPPEQIALRKRQRRLILAGVGAVLGGGLLWWTLDYVLSAPERSAEVYKAGMQFLHPGEYGDAVPRFTRAIDIYSKNADAYLARGLAHRYMGHRQEAVADFTRVLELQPKSVKAFSNRAAVYRETGNHRGALKDLTDAINIEPTPEAYYERGQTHESLGDFRSAMQDYGNVIEAYPTSPHAYRARALCRQKLGDEEGYRADTEAARLWERRGTRVSRR